MLKRRGEIIVYLIAVFLLSSCIEPYTPNLSGYESLLVVDAQVTNENSSYSVRLSKSFQEQNATPVVVSDASVYLNDDRGNTMVFKNKGNGIYQTDSTQFRGEVGRTYVLHILIGESEEYESEPCLMQPVPDIDSIYIAKDQQLVNNNTGTQDGVSIYLDSKWGDKNLYFRWTYDEAWKFKVSYPKKYDFLYDRTEIGTGLIIPTEPRLIPVSDVKEYCWKTHQGDNIIIRSNQNGQTGRLTKQPIYFIASDKSDRLMLQYSILIKQYSISKDEYEFWNKLNQVNVAGGDIFARQPYAVSGNIRNLKNLNERVLGYFKVSAVTQKRKNIPFSDFVALNLPFYHDACEFVLKSPADFDSPFKFPHPTWDDVYWYMCVQDIYTFIYPLYDPATNKLMKFVFTSRECANCELTGTRIKPDMSDDIK